MTFEKSILDISNDLINWRRHLHQYPELSFKEYRTSDFIVSTLQTFREIEIQRITKTGVVGRIFGKKQGKKAVLAIRADIDALPIQEENDLPFKSQQENTMHACGHDGHSAILLAVGRLLTESRENFCGEVRLIFQHAEELPPGGALEMLHAGVMNGVDAVLGLHLSTNWETGCFGIKSGVLTSSVDRFDVYLRGKGGHCAYPDQCTDPIPAMAELVLALQTVISRRMPPLEPAVISICTAQAGRAYNIIPDEASITASVRSFDQNIRSMIEQEIRKIVHGIATANGLAYEVVYEKGYPSIINDLALSQLAYDVLDKRFGESHIEKIGIIMPGEDFAYFLDGRPGFFVELGSRNVKKSCDVQHHNKKYLLDEDALLYGVQYFMDMVKILMDGYRQYL